MMWGDRALSSPSSNQNAPAPAALKSTELGLGSSIEVARESRAAQDALKRSDYAAAVSTLNGPLKRSQNAELWFLLGYAARLVDAIRLQLTPTTEAFSPA